MKWSGTKGWPKQELYKRTGYGQWKEKESHLPSLPWVKYAHLRGGRYTWYSYGGTKTGGRNDGKKNIHSRY
jgi:hypothetical protein